MPTITPNPLQDVIVKGMISRLDEGIYSELHKYRGQTPSSNELKESEAKLKALINTSLFQIGNYSLTEGCKEVSIAVPSKLVLDLHTTARSRADFSAHSIIATTAEALGIMYAALSKKGATGKKRSKSVATYEGPRIFFEQRRKGWGLRHGVRKAWYCQSDNVCDQCQDNEDDGPIEMIESFSSGDDYPPMHIGCECLMSLIL